MNKLCCLLPVYKNDNPNYFKLSIESILNQSHKSDLYVLCDGPLTIELENILKFYYNKLYILRYAQNRGLASVLNDGINYCIGRGYEYFARMDADDISLPLRFELQLKYLQKHPEIDLIGGAIQEIDENSSLLNKIIVYPLTHEECYKFFSKRDPLAHPSAIFRKSFFEKAGLYNIKYKKNQDTLFWLNGFKNNCIFSNIPEVVLYYRITNEFFAIRRSGLKRAFDILFIRIKISKELHYGVLSYIYAILFFIITILPSNIRRLLYKYFR